MRRLILPILTIVTAQALGQNGYVKIEPDSTLVGFLKYYVSFEDGRPGIELWRTKKDKSPLKIPKSTINEYAIKKDTFKVLHQFTPFYDGKTYFEVVDAKLKSRGKVNLYVIENYANANRVSTYTGGGLIPAIIDESLGNYTFMYILEDKKNGLLEALPSKKDELREVLLDFFPERYIAKYSEVEGEINYRSVLELVKLYNSK